MTTTHIHPKYFYNGISLTEHCRKTGLDYGRVCRIINTHRRRFNKELPVEEAVRRVMNKPTASDYIVKWAVNRMYCVILKDGKCIRDDLDQPKRFRNTKVANDYIRNLLNENI